MEISLFKYTYFCITAQNVYFLPISADLYITVAHNLGLCYLTYVNLKDCNFQVIFGC